MTQDMSTGTKPSGQASSRFRLSEDWIATIIGLAIVLVIGAGLIGLGPQSVSLKAKPGETVTANALAVDGWNVSATLGGEKVTIENAPTGLESNQVYGFICQEGAIEVGTILPEAGETSLLVWESGRALLALKNTCDADVSVSYKTSAAIPWPVFRIFDR
jgi:hypothetical protein